MCEKYFNKYVEYLRAWFNINHIRWTKFWLRLFTYGYYENIQTLRTIFRLQTIYLFGMYGILLLATSQKLLLKQNNFTVFYDETKNIILIILYNVQPYRNVKLFTSVKCKLKFHAYD